MIVALTFAMVCARFDRRHHRSHLRHWCRAWIAAALASATTLVMLWTSSVSDLPVVRVLPVAAAIAGAMHLLWVQLGAHELATGRALSRRLAPVALVPLLALAGASCWRTDDARHVVVDAAIAESAVWIALSGIVLLAWRVVRQRRERGLGVVRLLGATLLLVVGLSCVAAFTAPIGAGELALDPVAAGLGGLAVAVAVGVGQMAWTVEDEWTRRATSGAEADTLTGLPRRRTFVRSLEQAVLDSRAGCRRFTVLFVDLDRFKHINDHFGHAAGDRVLEVIGRRLRHVLRHDQLVARMGGDEFTILAPDVADEAEAQALAERVRDAIAAPVAIGGREVPVGASIGVSMFPDQGEDAPALLASADAAMYQLKARCAAPPPADERIAAHALAAMAVHGALRTSGASLASVVDEPLPIVVPIAPAPEPPMVIATETASAVSADADAARLLRAIESGELAVHYQPIVCALTGRIVAVESVLRWEHPTDGMLLPAAFLDLARRTGVLPAIGEWGLCAAVAQLAEWRAHGLPGLRVALNVFAQQLRAPGFADTLARALREHALPSSAIDLELADAATLLGDAEAIGRLRELGRLGVRVMVDDFGGERSPLRSAAQLPVCALKVPASALEPALAASEEATRVSLPGFARELGLELVVTRVETRRQLALAVAAGCGAWQGNLFIRPGAADEMATLLDWERSARHLLG
jgi:diguanylate cyclase (GGDEF)-like protein